VLRGTFSLISFSDEMVAWPPACVLLTALRLVRATNEFFVWLPEDRVDPLVWRPCAEPSAERFGCAVGWFGLARLREPVGCASLPPDADDFRLYCVSLLGGQVPVLHVGLPR